MTITHKQKLTTTDKPPSIPALRSNTDFSYVVDTFRPVSMDLSEIPDVIRRFKQDEDVEKKSPRKRVVSTPILDEFREPITFPKSYNIDTPVKIDRRVVSIPARLTKFKQLPDIPKEPLHEHEEELILQPPEITTRPTISNHNSFNSSHYQPNPNLSIPEKSQYARTTRDSNSSFHSHNSSGYSHGYHLPYTDDNIDYLTQEFSNLEYGNSNDDSLFSEPLNDRESTEEVEEPPKELPPVPQILPKVRNNKKSAIPANRNSLYLEKHNIIEQVKQRPFSYCLDLKNEYEESRYPVVTTSLPKVGKTPTTSPRKHSRRSVSDLQSYIKTTKEKLHNTRIASFIHHKQEVPKPTPPPVPCEDKKLPMPPQVPTKDKPIAYKVKNIHNI